MLLTLSASLLVLAADPPKGAMCVRSTYDNGDYITFVIPTDRLSEFSGKAATKRRKFDVIDCPSKWSAATTQKFCDAIDKFSDDLKSAMKEIYSISPDEMCEAAKEVGRLDSKT